MQGRLLVVEFVFVKATFGPGRGFRCHLSPGLDSPFPAYLDAQVVDRSSNTSSPKADMTNNRRCLVRRITAYMVWRKDHQGFRWDIVNSKGLGLMGEQHFRHSRSVAGRYEGKRGFIAVVNLTSAAFDDNNPSERHLYLH